ncbi:MAG: hypothetical protein LBH59_09445 [Planctomycetaceae bacterium]|jgi:hypothetical protein|nr:hypothetical protein [Planctomycetaceae bacterium]
MSVQNASEILDKTIDSRIDVIRKILFKAEFLSSVLFLMIFLVAGFFIAVIADQWLFTDGLSVLLRFGIFIAMFTLSAFFVYRRIVPLFLYPINPVYAAQILENNSDSTKNAIINWITLKRERTERGRVAADKLGEKMLEGLTRAAAENVNAVSEDRIVNKAGINIYIAALVIIVMIFILYALFSPKNPAQSFARIILPFAEIKPPLSVKFLDITPQNTMALQGEHLTISAKIASKSQSPVYVFFTTDDGRAVKQAVPMNKLSNSSVGNFWQRNKNLQFEAPFPPDKQGFICSTDYWIQQDNNKSNTYRIEVRPIATIEVESLTYKYPDYTGLSDAVVLGNGDIRAVSGTEVTVRAKSTMPLSKIDIVYDKKATASNESNKSNKNNTPNPPTEISMKINKDNPTIASANISLKNDSQVDQDSSDKKEFVNYFTINATDQDGFKNRRSGTFRQETTLDKPPIIQWSDVAENLEGVAQIDLPLGAEIELPLQAEDPDFAIRYLRVKYKVASNNRIDKQIRPSELLQSPITGATEHKGQIKKSTKFKPTQHNLNIGDTVEVWGEVVDTKLPKPNVAETRHITIKIVKQQENNNDNNENKTGENKTNENNQQNQTQDNAKENNPEKNSATKNDQQNENEQNENNQDNNKNPKPNSNDDNIDENKNNADNNNNDVDNNGKKNGNDKSNKPLDPETQSADAMQKIVDRMKKENWQSQSDADKNDPEKQDQNKQDQQKQNNNNEKNNQKENPPNQSNTNEQNSCNNSDDNSTNKGENKTCENNNNQNGSKGSEKETGNEKGNSSSDDNSSDNSKSNPNSQDSTSGKNENSNGDKNGNSNGKSGDLNNSSDSGESSKDGDPTKKSNDNNGGDQSNNSNNSSDNNDVKKSQNNNSDGEKKSSNNDVNKGSGNKGNSEDSQNADQENKVTKTEDQPIDENDQDKRSRGEIDSNSGKVKNEGNDSSGAKESDFDRSKENQLSSKEKNNSKETDTNSSSDQSQSNADSDSNSKTDSESKSSSSSSSSSNSSSQQKSSDIEKSDKNSDSSSGGQSGGKSSKGSKVDDSQDGLGSGDGLSDSLGKSSENLDSSKGGLSSGNTGRGGIGGSDDLGEAESVRREFTERNVNLALDYLRDQLDRGQPSKELLDELGWTEEQLRAFHEKWRAMSENSKRNNTSTKANEAWENALKSFNIRPTGNSPRLRTNKSTIKDNHQKSQSKNLSPPKKFEQKFEKYTTGIGQ